MLEEALTASSPRLVSDIGLGKRLVISRCIIYNLGICLFFFFFLFFFGCSCIRLIQLRSPASHSPVFDVSATGISWRNLLCAGRAPRGGRCCLHICDYLILNFFFPFFSICSLRVFDHLKPTFLAHVIRGWGGGLVEWGVTFRLQGGFFFFHLCVVLSGVVGAGGGSSGVSKRSVSGGRGDYFVSQPDKL